MCAVCSTESIVYENVCQGSELFGELLAVLSLFLAITGVLKENNIAVLHSSNSCLCVLADYVVIFCEDNFLAQALGEALCYGSQRHLGLGLALRLAEVGAKDHLAAVSDQLLDGGKSCDDTVVIGDDACLERHIEIAAAKDAFALYVNIINRFLVKTHSKNPPFVKTRTPVLSAPTPPGAEHITQPCHKKGPGPL